MTKSNNLTQEQLDVRPSVELDSRPSMDLDGRPSMDQTVLMHKKQIPPWSEEFDVVLDEFDTSADSGLSNEEAAKRLKQNGHNVLPTRKKANPFLMLIRHFFNFLMLVLIAAVILSAAIGDYADAGVIAFVIVVNTLIGFIQEYKSEKTMASLMKLSDPSSLVLREGKRVEVKSSDLVVGDIVFLKHGNFVPADLRLIEAVNLEANEALLTGESVPLVKNANQTLPADHPLAERSNMAYMSTAITKGRGMGVVVCTGKATELGKIATSLSSKKKNEMTPLQRRMNILGKVLVVCAIIIMSTVFLASYLHHNDVNNALLLAISTAIAIIPEGLVAVVTLTMSIGVRSMAKNKAIVRKLAALEALGNITDICSDKTGTLTEGKMVSTQLWLWGRRFSITGAGVNPEDSRFVHDPAEENAMPFADMKSVQKMYLVCHLCNTSSLHKNEATAEWEVTGDPTEIALKVMAHKMMLAAPSENLEEYAKDLPLEHEFPFNSDTKRMTVVYNMPHHKLVLTKGAPDNIIRVCNRILDAESAAVQPMPDDFQDHYQEAYNIFASMGLRVLALAYSEVPDAEFPEEPTQNNVETNLVFIGLVGIRDPPRAETKPAVMTCKSAGITVRMVTGDHPMTAKTIAEEVMILDPAKKGRSVVLAAAQFDAIPDEDLADKTKTILPVVVARCTPQSKVKLIEALHARGRYVAMTGDGVNDAPAIEKADIGIAMGKNGSDVTKQVADIVLTDDNFSTIAEAVREGRRIFLNIRKFVIHLMSSNVAEVIALMITILPGLKVPLTPIQILWLNLVTGTPCAVSLGVEKGTKDIMRKKMRALEEGLFTHEVTLDILVYGAMMGCFTLGVFFYLLNVLLETDAAAQAAAFATLTILHLGHAYNCRHQRHSFLKDQVWRSYWIHLAFLVGVGSLCFTFYVPFVHDVIFHQEAPTVEGWAGAFIALGAFMFLSEMYKLLKRLVVYIIKKRRRNIDVDDGIELHATQLNTADASTANLTEISIVVSAPQT